MAQEMSETRQRAVQGATVGAGVVMALVLFVMVNYLAERHYKRFDTTSSQLYTLSEKSLGVVQALDREIEMVLVIGAGAGGELFEAVDELLSRYEAANPTFLKKRVVDLARDPFEARKLAQEYEISEGTAVVLAAGEDRSFIDQFDLADYDYSGAQFGQAPTLEAFKGEEKITSSILELAEDRKPRVLFTAGHGEAPLSAGNMRSLSAVRDYLEKANFELEEWPSLGATEVPEGTDLVVIASPTRGFLDTEREVLSAYLDGGGRVLVFLDLQLDGSALVDSGLSGWLAGYGVTVDDNLILDPSSPLAFAGPGNIAADAFGNHPIVDPLAENQLPVLFSLARSVRAADEAPEGLEITQLIETSAEAWGETNLEDLENLAKDDADLAGPLGLGVAVSFRAGSLGAGDEPQEGEDLEGEDLAMEDLGDAEVEGADEARLVVFGDLEFVSDLSISNAGNSTVLINAFNWLVQREHLITIDRKPPEQTSLSLTSSEAYQLYLLVLLLMPGVAVVAGLWIYSRRRR